MQISDIILFRSTLCVRILNKDKNENIESIWLKNDKFNLRFSFQKKPTGWDKVYNKKLSPVDNEFIISSDLITKERLRKSNLLITTNKRKIVLPIKEIQGLVKKNTRAKFDELVHQNIKKSTNFVEIGSRSRSGNVYTQQFKESKLKYIGFDIEEGPNVDVVGDAHKLSQYFEKESVDFIFSISTYEHLLCPWIAAIEMNKVLKTNGIAYIQSHQTWPLHEEPADYFRFSKYAWEGLFNKLSGFKIIDVANENPCYIVPSRYDLHGRREQFDNEIGYMMSCCLIQKTGKPMVDWSLNNINLHELTGQYPK